jgi:hypothetical protein
MVADVLWWDLPSAARDWAWRHARTEESDQLMGHRLALGHLLLAVLSFAVLAERRIRRHSYIALAPPSPAGLPFGDTRCLLSFDTLDLMAYDDASFHLRNSAISLQ